MWSSRWIRAIFQGATAIWIGLAACSPSSAIEYPIIFKSPLTLRKVGLALAYGDHPKPYPNKCYYYGDGGYLISLSNSFLARFVRQGFTLQSACLGLISQTIYDPETGRRLPTYQLIDPDMIASRSEEPGASTEELPLELPACFKNGVPYADCTFRYGRQTGKALSSETTESYRQLGAAINAALAAEVARDPSIKEELYGADPSEHLIAGFRKDNGRGLPESAASIDEKILRNSSFSFWVRSTKLSRGFGYALDADGTAGPSLSSEAMTRAVSGLRKPQVSADDIQQALDARK